VPAQSLAWATKWVNFGGGIWGGVLASLKRGFGANIRGPKEGFLNLVEEEHRFFWGKGGVYLKNDGPGALFENV